MRSTLLDMLTYCRPMGSRAERQFRKRFLLGLPGAVTDPWGNIHIVVGPAPTVLWSCHTDTVHRASGRQRVIVEASEGQPWARLPEGGRSSCLGADDTVGCYLMREMILQRVPGEYVFHWGEERGGIGSRALVAARPQWAGQFLAAIALDRQDEGDIITHQACGRTCSDVFAWSLADALEDAGLRGYAPTEGVYTDTAEYADIVPECTNLSVGYRWQHSEVECVNLAHVDRLLGALCDLDWATLTIERDPTVPDLGRYADWPSEGLEDDGEDEDDLVDLYQRYSGGNFAPWWDRRGRMARFDR